MPHKSFMRSRLSPQSGIAIGVILFVLALIAVISIAISASGNFAGTTIAPDRINQQLKSQANLIKNKLAECVQNGTMRLDANFTNSSAGGYIEPYPSSTGTGTLVEALNCPSYGSSVQNLWTGQAPLLLPAPPNGFDKWVYVNAGDIGGRCIRIQPSTGNTTDAGVKQGLSNAAATFTSMELVYDSNSSSQRFIIWITKPTGSASADCSS